MLVTSVHLLGNVTSLPAQAKILTDLLFSKIVFVFLDILEKSALRNQPVSGFHTLKSFWPL